MSRNLIFYILVIAIFGSLLWFVFDQGAKLDVLHSSQAGIGEGNEATSAVNPDVEATIHEGTLVGFLKNLSQNFEHPLSLLLLQIVTIVLSSKLLASLFSKIGQPLVIGEIIAGILLGPSVLGHFFPHVSNFIFQANSLSNLNFLSQLGLILFMFIVGLEMDVHLLKHKAHTAIVVSHASIIIPFSMGVSLAYFLYSTFLSWRSGFLWASP